MKIFPKMNKPDDKNPSLSYDFHYQWTNFTIRFAGNPILLLEVIYKEKWGERFNATYKAFKEGKALEYRNKTILIEAIKETNKILEYFVVVNEKKGLSPFVIYTSNK